MADRHWKSSRNVKYGLSGAHGWGLDIKALTPWHDALIQKLHSFNILFEFHRHA